MPLDVRLSGTAFPLGRLTRRPRTRLFHHFIFHHKAIRAMIASRDFILELRPKPEKMITMLILSIGWLALGIWLVWQAELIPVAAGVLMLAISCVSLPASLVGMFSSRMSLTLTQQGF